MSYLSRNLGDQEDTSMARDAQGPKFDACLTLDLTPASHTGTTGCSPDAPKLPDMSSTTSPAPALGHLAQMAKCSQEEVVGPPLWCSLQQV